MAICGTIPWARKISFPCAGAVRQALKKELPKLTEAAKACLQYGLEVLKMKRIVASMETKNLASKAVAENIGLRLEQEFVNSRNRDLPTFLLSTEAGQ